MPKAADLILSILVAVEIHPMGARLEIQNATFLQQVVSAAIFPAKVLDKDK